MSEPFLSEIRIMSFNFAPKGWAFCNGQLLPINQNQALFSLLGTTYGGNGQTTYALPNLQSRLPVHQGQGQGLSSYALGQAGGVPTVTLDQQTTPTHLHTFNATSATGATCTIAASVLPGTVPSSLSTPQFYAQQLPSPNPPLDFQN